MIEAEREALAKKLRKKERKEKRDARAKSKVEERGIVTSLELVPVDDVMAIDREQQQKQMQPRPNNIEQDYLVTSLAGLPQMHQVAVPVVLPPDVMESEVPLALPAKSMK